MDRTQISLHLSAETKERIEKLAAAEHRATSNMIARLIDYALPKFEAERTRRDHEESENGAR